MAELARAREQPEARVRPMTKKPKPSQPRDRVITSVAERRPALLEVIRRARHRITLSLFRCNDAAILAELAQAAARGVAVEVLLTSRAKGDKKKRTKLSAALEAIGAVVWAHTDPVVKYHAKYLVADDGPAVVASLNLTRKCFERTCDAVVLTHDPEVVTGLRQLMAADRDGLPAPESLSDRLIIGPERARRQLTALIVQARTSIRLIDAKLSDPDLGAPPEGAPRRGADRRDLRVQAARRVEIPRQDHAHRRCSGPLSAVSPWRR